MNRLKELRAAKEMRREDLASAARVSYSLIQQLETGEVDSTKLDTARRIADALGVTVDEVFPPEVETPAEPVPVQVKG